MPQQVDHADDDDWGNWMPQNAGEEQPEQAAEDAEEEFPEGAQAIGHAKDGRLMVRTRGGTVKLIGDTDGVAPAPTAPKGKAGGRGKDGSGKPSGKRFTAVKAELAEARQGRGPSIVKEELTGSDHSPQARLRRAVAFLTKPQMLKRTWDQKRSFLKSQGLNEEEIREARQRAEWAGVPAAEGEAQDYETEEATLPEEDAEPATTFE